MPLDIVRGESRNRTAAEALVAQLRTVVVDGTVYLGYPMLATADDRVEVDALLVSQSHGLVAFLLADDVPTDQAEWDHAIEAQDKLFTVLESYLKRHEALRHRRRLALTPSTATIFPARVSRAAVAGEGFYGDVGSVPDFVLGLPGISEGLERAVQAALQRVTSIKPAKKRASVEKPTSRGAKLKDIEKGIANLDQWQKAAAIESPEGPQRIRGLAGSGKTVVLALKAAYLHSQHPDWNIVFTFHTRSLYQQIDDLVTRFMFAQNNDRPDPEQLRIIHSWGSRGRVGVYSLIAAALGETVRDWSYARGKYGMDDAFRGVCQELLAIADTQEVIPVFDAVLIDEAQDLPPEFFQLVYRFTKDPKRIVWGYDELQKLSESAMPSTDELFGVGPAGQSLVNLSNAPDSPRQDIVLPVCYRNTPWALATAHALGIGVYREGGLVQHPDEPSLWQDIGYNVVHGRLAEGQRVTLQRSSRSSPEYFERLLDPADSVVIRTFPDEGAHDAWIAEEIAKNLEDDEIEESDILIVLPDTYRAKTRAPRLIKALRRKEIEAHLAGVNTSVDEVFRPGSIAIAHIHRAKGNEAPMVYAVDSHYSVRDFNPVTRRNTLFTAITRSRAWVRITGWGDGMRAIEAEVQEVVDQQFKLEFTIPTAGQLAEMRHTYRDRSDEDEEEVKKATAAASALLAALDGGKIDFYDLPPAVRTRLATRISLDVPDADE
ncbi:DEAD/DEAH box helicase [Micromonospora wenchangensis]